MKVRGDYVILGGEWVHEQVQVMVISLFVNDIVRYFCRFHR
ncbi:hypothetical protein GCWU000325_00944 [Alloprevotella tannerae ATCC 51259]|uniref:Uncharacterized protein n=1 Tax=Alloprevotella tannerae ATCC 51259 TaxID=626522 RepID=C9LFG2_9BACT|nr:hypothetical protein GCWU000325_00944 [Alloprevotella tannerae ATCC 51259]